MINSLQGKTVVITGASRGIGLGIARGFAAAGAKLTLIADDDAVVDRARDIGAAGFVGKSLPIMHILQALDRVARGGEWFNHTAEPVEPRAGPTARQLEVLNLIARGQQNKQISQELGIAERTVKLHVTALLGALGARNRTHLLVRAREAGLT